MKKLSQILRPGTWLTCFAIPLGLATLYACVMWYHVLAAHALGNLVWVLLDTAGLRVQAPDRLIAIARYLPIRVEHDGAAAAAALVDPKHITLRHGRFDSIGRRGGEALLCHIVPSNNISSYRFICISFFRSARERTRYKKDDKVPLPASHA